jgi:nicotinamidase-related amidase
MMRDLTPSSLLNVIVVEDCCAAGTEELHCKELEILNMIYCQVLSSAELRETMGLD